VYGGLAGEPDDEAVEALKKEQDTMTVPYPKGMMLGGETKWLSLMLGMLSEAVSTTEKEEFKKAIGRSLGIEEEEEEGSIEESKKGVYSMFSMSPIKNNNRPNR